MILKTGLRPERTARRRLFVVAFDPGKVTGWAIIRLDYETLVERGFRFVCVQSEEADLIAWKSGEFFGTENYITDCMLALLRGVWEEGDWSADGDVLVVVNEDFRLLEMVSSDEDLLSPVRINAKFDYAADRLALPMPRLLQSPSDRTVIDDARLQAHRLWPINGKDAKSAVQHATMMARKFVEPQWRGLIEHRCRWLHRKAEGAG